MVCWLSSGNVDMLKLLSMLSPAWVLLCFSVPPGPVRDSAWCVGCVCVLVRGCLVEACDCGNEMVQGNSGEGHT